MVQHWSRNELTTNQPASGHAAPSEFAQAQDIPTYQTAHAFRQADGASLYRDDIHPTVAGQKALLQNFKQITSDQK